MSLRSQSVHGVKWSGVSSLVTTVIQIVQLLVLARLIAPEDFGLMAMITVVIGLVQIYADMGISGAIIQRQEIPISTLSSLYWLNFILGLAIFSILWAAGPLVSMFYGDGRLGHLLKWMAVIFLITPIGQQFQVLLEKDLRFKQLALIEIAAVSFGFIVATVSALMHYGIYAIIFGQLINTMMRSAGFAIVGIRSWPVKAHFKASDFRGFVQFGLYQLGEKSVNYLGERLDQLMIGTMLGAQVLGYYSFAFTLAAMPVVKINTVLNRVAIPIFSRVQQSTDSLRTGYFTLIRVISVSNFPILLGMVALAPTFFPIVFGERWIPAIHLLQLLAIVNLFRSIGNPIGVLLLAKGRADWGFYWNMLLIVTHIPSVYIGIHYGGAIGVVIALVILQIILSIFNYSHLICPMLGYCLIPYINSFLPALIISMVVGISTAMIEHALRIIANPGVLFAEIAQFVLMFSLLMWLFMKNEVKALIQLIFAKNFA